MGFEPTRAEPIGLAVQRLNHSATSSGWLHTVKTKTTLYGSVQSQPPQPFLRCTLAQDDGGLFFSKNHEYIY